MALLIFPPDSLDKNPQLASLLQPGLRMEVASKVNEAILATQGKRREAKIIDLVHLRAWAEKERREGPGKGALPAKLSLGLETGNETRDEGMRDGADGEAGEDGEEDDDEEQHGNGGDLMVQ